MLLGTHLEKVCIKWSFDRATKEILVCSFIHIAVFMSKTLHQVQETCAAVKSWEPEICHKERLLRKGREMETGVYRKNMHFSQLHALNWAWGLRGYTKDFLKRVCFEDRIE